GETETVEAMQQRVEADLEYLRNWSLGLDIKIVFRTVAVMFSDTKAY
ncbi:MAG: sugar transferase, partial [Gammaproteobacteria bacterium]|nr:sugar transferase [Gammaproteobacteria bacterium]